MQANPFTYCPQCKSQHLRFTRDHRISCEDCGFVYYHNVAAATGCFIHTNKGLLLVERNKNPQKGKLDVPGGFMEPNESALEGLRRECLEEIGFDPGENAAFLAAYPNTYFYKQVLYNTCDMFFTVEAPGLELEDLKIDASELGLVRFVIAQDLQLDEFGFASTRRAAEKLLGLCQF